MAEPDMTRTIRAKPRRPPDSFDAESASEYTHLNNTTVMRSNVGFDSGYFEINVVAAGPDWSDDIICAAGSNRGILQWKGEHYVSLNGSLKWTAPTVTNRLTIDNPFHDIFAVDFRRNHESIIFGGGRPGRCFVADSRTCDVEWLSFSHGSSIAHIKSLNDHQVLVSGTRNLMKIYDVRMVKGHTRIVSKYVCQSVGVDPDRSIVSFPEYKNDAYNKLGFSVDLEAGLVATAHDDGKVALHSLKSGHQLKSPAVDAIQADVQNRGPVKALQFEKLSGDSHKSLFAAVGNNLELYSLGVTDHSNEA